MKNRKFTELYIQYRNLIMKIVVDRLGDRALAEEISQQVFAAFYQNMDTVKDEFIKPWLMLSAKNAIVDFLRKKNTRNEILASEYIGRIDVVAEDNTEKIIERIASVQLSFRILEDLKETNEDWYAVIMAVCVQDMTQEEAAKHLQMTSQALRAKLYRARKYIRSKYIKDFRDCGY